MRMKDKRVLITGGARGIGQGIAGRFLQEGAKVFIIDKRIEELQAAISQFKKFNKEADYAVCDLSNRKQLEETAQISWDRWNGLDILINNAGIAARESFIDIPLERWEEIMNVNLNSMFLLSQIICKNMIKQSTGGVVVNMASKNGLSGSSKLAHYNASKGGVHLLTQSMAVDLAPYHIRVNAVAPGFIDTPLDQELKRKEGTELVLTDRTPMKRLGTIEEVANAFLFLASDEASYITGTTLVVDGGHLANAGEF